VIESPRRDPENLRDLFRREQSVQRQGRHCLASTSARTLVHHGIVRQVTRYRPGHSWERLIKS
jgi:hypothetical protein